MEKPDVIGTQAGEAEDAAKGTATQSAIWSWPWTFSGTERRVQRSNRWYDKMAGPPQEKPVEPERPEKRWLRSKRWYEKMPFAELEAKLREMMMNKGA
jgi:hypothetical protein